MEELGADAIIAVDLEDGARVRPPVLRVDVARSRADVADHGRALATHLDQGLFVLLGVRGGRLRDGLGRRGRRRGGRLLRREQGLFRLRAAGAGGGSAGGAAAGAGGLGAAGAGWAAATDVASRIPSARPLPRAPGEASFDRPRFAKNRVRIRIGIFFLRGSPRLRGDGPRAGARRATSVEIAGRCLTPSGCGQDGRQEGSPRARGERSRRRRREGASGRAEGRAARVAARGPSERRRVPSRHPATRVFRGDRSARGEGVFCLLENAPIRERIRPDDRPVRLPTERSPPAAGPDGRSNEPSRFRSARRRPEIGKRIDENDTSAVPPPPERRIVAAAGAGPRPGDHHLRGAKRGVHRSTFRAGAWNEQLPQRRRHSNGWPLGLLRGRALRLRQEPLRRAELRVVERLLEPQRHQQDGHQGGERHVHLEPDGGRLAREVPPGRPAPPADAT
jgi:hypothetical protein